MAEFGIEAGILKAASLAYPDMEGIKYGPARGAYEKAQKNVARLHEEIDRLLSRVKPALAPEAPLPGENANADRDVVGQSEVTGSFLDLADQLERAARRINAITSRVDL